MEYHAIYAPSAEDTNPEGFVFVSREEALKALKANKESRLKSFKNHNDALKFAKSGSNLTRQESSSILDTISILKSPPPSVEKHVPRNMEKSNYPAPKSQDLVKFRKEIEQNNVQRVYEMINTNPRYLVSSGDTPAILKEGPRYNALHVAAMNKHAKMAKLILQTVEQPQFIEMLHGFKNDPNIDIMSQNLLEWYLNTPDKSRNETPLHFAAKIGAIDVIQVLLSYPLCKMKQNSEGLYPKDIVCARCPNAAPDLKKSIEELLNERFFVPVLRSSDNSVQPLIGEPFTTSKMPKFATDPHSPSLEIKAYAGPMSSEQAQTFQKRWKTPPRLVASTANCHNISFSPQSHSISSPLLSPRMSKSLSEVVSSTPKLKKRLKFEGNEDDDFESVYLSNVKHEQNDRNGNHEFGVLSKHEEEEFKELFEDLWKDKQQQEEIVMKSYRNPEPCIGETPLKMKNDSNSNHIHENFNNSPFYDSPGDSLLCNPPSSNLASGHITFLDESGSMYSSDNIQLSQSFKEKNIRLTDPNKGLEKIGRTLAQEYNVGWKEYWEFLGSFLDIRSSQGLESFEEYLKKREKKKELNETDGNAKQPSSPRSLNDSFGLNSICAGLYSMDLNDELMERKENMKTQQKNGLVSPSISRSPLMEMLSNMRQSSNDVPLMNPYTCIEMSCRTFAKRVASLLESESIQDQSSYEKTLLVEINKLNMSIDSYKRDSRFASINFQKVHARYSYLLVWSLKANNIDVKYLRNLVPLMSKVYTLASQYTLPDAKDLIKSHAMCISTFTRNYIERQEKIFNPENVDSETACVDAWNGPDIIECKCPFETTYVSIRQKICHRRDIRKRLYSGSNGAKKVDLWSIRNPSEEFEEDEDEDEKYLSCESDLSSDEDEYFTPPQSPILPCADSDDDEMNVFEESLEHLEDEKEYSLFINGDEPTKVDVDVFNAIGESFNVDDSKYPFVSKWHRAMRSVDPMNIQKSLIKVQSQKQQQQHLAFRLFTPKLKC